MQTGERFGMIFDGGTMLGLGSAELLGRFAERRDEAAFAALVARHGPMVLATCRRILPDRADADDAFQATFLVLARKAASIGDPDRLAPWLHGVARRVATRVRALAARRRAIEGERPEPGEDEREEPAVAPPRDDAFELRSILDEELARLPAKYRDPLVLCYLEGLTHDEAAGQLQWPVGTVRSRLAGGRDRLRGRLTRRGYASGALAVLSPPTLPTLVVSHSLQTLTIRLVFSTASQTAATSAALIAQGVLTSMLLTKFQTITVATFAVAATLAAGTAGVLAAQSSVLTPTEAKSGASPAATSTDLDQARPAVADRPPSTDLPVASPATEPVELRRELTNAKIRIAALEAALARTTATNRANEAAAPVLDVPPIRPGGVSEMNPLQAGQERPAATPTPAPTRQAEMQQVGQTGLLMVTSAGRDRVTMIEPRTGRKATLQLGKPVDAIEPVEMQGGGAAPVGLKLQGPEIAKLAVFDPAAMRWHEHTLTDPVTRADPIFNNSGTWMTFALKGPKVAEAPAFSLRSLEWRPDALTGPPQKQVASIVTNNGTKVTQAGPFYYFSNTGRPKAVMLEVKRPAQGKEPRSVPDVGLTAHGTIVVRGITALSDGTLCVQDDDVLNIYHPKEVELTQVDLAAEQ